MTRSFAVKTVHKGMYPATYNFKDEADGAFPSGWTDQDGAGCATTVIATKDGHRKVLQFYDNSAIAKAQARILFTQGLNSEIEFWFTKSSVAADTNFEVVLYEGGTRVIWLVFQDDDLDYYDVAWNSIKDDFLVANTLSHFRFVLDDTANTFSCYIDGVLIGAAYAYENNTTSGIDGIIWKSDSTDTGFYAYLDALGVSTDTDYNIGDNIHWRHFKDSMAQANFEGEDVGTSGTSITFIDAITGTDAVIEPSFDEHKKVLHFNGDGGWDIITNNFSSGQANGTVEFGVKIGETNQNHGFAIYDGDYWAAGTIGIHLNWNAFGNLVYYTAVAVFHTIVAYSAATWYHIKIEFECAAGAYKGLAADTFYIWIDNLRYGPYAFENGIDDGDQILFSLENANTDITLDAIGYSWETDYEIADNRLLEYNDTYTKTDITTDVKNIPNYQNNIYGHRKATLHAKSSYEFDNIFFEIYDINSKLAMRGEIKNRMQIDKLYQYPLRDMNWDDLNEPITNVFATDKIHDPTDSTSMLKTALPNVDQTEGDLILSDADTKAATYSPTLRNYPTHMFLRDISDLADSVTIVKASGIVLLDDDLGSGDTLDIDVTADKNSMTMAPIIVDILETINYFEIFGAINPDTGERFHKITDNSGTDKKRKWRYTNNELLNQTDVDAYTAALILRTIPVRLITVQVQGLGAHNMGTTLNYKYIKGLISIAQANYYIISEYINFDRNLATIILSEGLIEESKYSASFEKPENYVNSYASEIYETDINTVFPAMQPFTGADWQFGKIRLDAVNETIACFVFIPSEVDDNRDITIIWCYENDVGGAASKAYKKYIKVYPSDGSTAPTVVYDYTAHTTDNIPDLKVKHEVWTLAHANFTSPCSIQLEFMSNDVDDFRIHSCTIKYFIKRPIT